MGQYLPGQPASKKRKPLTMPAQLPWAGNQAATQQPPNRLTLQQVEPTEGLPTFRQAPWVQPDQTPISGEPSGQGNSGGFGQNNPFMGAPMPTIQQLAVRTPFPASAQGATNSTVPGRLDMNGMPVNQGMLPVHPQIGTSGWQPEGTRPVANPRDVAVLGGMNRAPTAGPNKALSDADFEAQLAEDTRRQNLYYGPANAEAKAKAYYAQQRVENIERGGNATITPEDRAGWHAMEVTGARTPEIGLAMMRRTKEAPYQTNPAWAQERAGQRATAREQEQIFGDVDPTLTPLTPSQPGAIDAQLASLKAARPQYTPMAERQAMVLANAQNVADARGARRGRVPWEDVRQPITTAQARYQVKPTDENFLAAYPQAAPWKYQAEAMGGKMEERRSERAVESWVRGGGQAGTGMTLPEFLKQTGAGASNMSLDQSPAAKIATAIPDAASRKTFLDSLESTDPQVQERGRWIGKMHGLTDEEMDSYYPPSKKPEVVRQNIITQRKENRKSLDKAVPKLSPSGRMGLRL